jgi:hypothetical protein
MSSVKRRRVAVVMVGCLTTMMCVAAMCVAAPGSGARQIVPLPPERPQVVPLPQERPRILSDQSSGSDSQWSDCDQRLTELAQFKPLPLITGPGECMASDVVLLDAVRLPNNERVDIAPPATLRCPMAEAVAHWLRDDIAPTIATLGTRMRSVETAGSFDCRPRDGIAGAKLSEHGRANALDVRAFKLAKGAAIALNDAHTSKPLRERIRDSACSRFPTVLGNGADAYHETHVHLDLLQRHNNYRLCQWDVLDEAETAARAAAKAAALSQTPTSAIPLPRPRPNINSQAPSSERHGLHRHTSVSSRRNRLASLFRQVSKAQARPSW